MHSFSIQESINSAFQPHGDVSGAIYRYWLADQSFLRVQPLFSFVNGAEFRAIAATALMVKKYPGRLVG